MKKKKILLIISVVVVAVIIAAALFAKIYLFTTYNYESVRFNIGRNYDKAMMDSVIKGDLGDSFGKKVVTLANLMHVSPKQAHGSYQVRPGMTVLELTRNLKQGRQTPVKLTFNNMRYLSELGSRVGTVLEFDSIDFMNGCDAVLTPMGYTKEAMSAAFLPDTYEFYWTDSPQKVINKLLDEHNRFWNEERLQKAEKLGYTPTEIATIASIVEEESNKREERPAIARVYMNRLKQDMPLQADPTIKFALGDWSIRRIGRKHLQADSPYNTYDRTGLPPGPIRIVDRSSIDAVLDAPEHDYVFMCAKPDFSGFHNFASTYAEHRINAAKYHRALDARGIKNF